MSISRLRMATDGPGVSTLVTFWGCPLQCEYCANWMCHDALTHREAYTPEQLVAILRQDDIYFKMTGGGIVFGGGEPLLQAKFIHDVCKIIDPLWKKRIETSLYAGWDEIELLIDDIDEWFIDIKDMNAQIYKSYTGKDNSIVIENIKKNTYKGSRRKNIDSHTIYSKCKYIERYYKINSHNQENGNFQD